MGLPPHGVVGNIPGLLFFYCLGAPHVYHRHGDLDQCILPDHDDDHLNTVGRHPVGTHDNALRRINPI